MTDKLAPSTTERKCSYCKVTKPLEEFTRENGRSLGRSYRCRECNKTYSKELRKTGINKIYLRKVRKEHNEKVTARRLAAVIPLPDKCERCSKKTNLHHHHPDYSKPLEIIALCVDCHELEHHPYKPKPINTEYLARQGKKYLTTEQVNYIKDNKGLIATKKLAEKFGIHSQTVYDIWKGRSRKNG